MSDQLERLLKKHFGFESFRGVQKPILQSLQQGRSVLGIMPTGEGKSLCYQLPCFLDLPTQGKGGAEPGDSIQSVQSGQGDPSLVLVVSPLIALMQDQVQKARSLKIRAACLHSAMERSQRESVQNDLAQGRWQLVFVTPERFRKAEFVQALMKNSIRLFVVDEAHCISAWGHDFRPDYLRLGEIRKLLREPLTLALTATATPPVQLDILKHLGLKPDSSLTVSSGFLRPELALHVHEVSGLDEKVRSIAGLLLSGSAPQQTHLVYVTLISTLLKLSQELERLGLHHEIYHGELEPSRRRRVLRTFQESSAVVVLATPAFGLGVDRADVRSVVHAELPASLEAYYQEVGRAGRDRKPAEGHLLWDSDDVSLQMQFIESAFPEVADVEFAYRWMEANWLRVKSEGLVALREQISFKNSRDSRVDSILRILERAGAVRYDSGQHEASRLHFELVQAPDREILQEILNPEIKKQAQKNLLSIVSYANLQSGCRRQFILSHFGETSSPACGVCDLCVEGADSGSVDSSTGQGGQ